MTWNIKAVKTTPYPRCPRISGLLDTEQLPSLLSQVLKEEKGREVQHPGKRWWIKSGFSVIQRVQRGVRWRRGRQWKAARQGGFRLVSSRCFTSGCQGSWCCMLSSPQTPLTLCLFQVKVSFPQEGDKQ